MTAHDDDGVCYRHPDRHSWVLCERCGRTICPECQLPTPNGVYCPECVRETSGSAPRWAPVGTPAPSNVTPIRRRRSPRWVKQLREMLVPESGAPVVTWSVVVALIVTFLVDLFARGLLFASLAAYPGQEPWQLWRYFTSALVTPPNGFSGLGLVINIVFFVLVAPTMERQLGRARFVTVLLAGAGAGSAAMLLAGSIAYGLTGVMFGLFAAYFVVARQSGAPMTRFLAFMLVNVLITLVLNAIFVIMLVGGVIGGGGAAALFFFHRDRGTRNPRTAYWQIAGGVGLLIGLAVLRTALT
jgi:membrane associated rhomboid family serine protease